MTVYLYDAVLTGLPSSLLATCVRCRAGRFIFAYFFRGTAHGRSVRGSGGPLLATCVRCRAQAFTVLFSLTTLTSLTAARSERPSQQPQHAAAGATRAACVSPGGLRPSES